MAIGIGAEVGFAEVPEARFIWNMLAALMSVIPSCSCWAQTLSATANKNAMRESKTEFSLPVHGHVGHGRNQTRRFAIEGPGGEASIRGGAVLKADIGGGAVNDGSCTAGR